MEIARGELEDSEIVEEVEEVVERIDGDGDFIKSKSNPYVLPPPLAPVNIEDEDIFVNKLKRFKL